MVIVHDARDRGTALRNWAPWLVLVLLAGAARTFDLGARVMSHDEALHAYTSFQLFSTGAYRHDPVYHGPLLYYVNALVYFVLGASDATARLGPAIAGTALVALMALFRRYVGGTAALTAGALAACSPTLLFYSRYIREDIYVALFTVLWIYGAFRYMDERRPRWLALVTASMALSFTTKESSFLFGAVIGSFFLVHALRPNPRNPGLRGGAADLAALMFSLVAPFAAGPIFVWLGWDPVDRQPAVDRLAGAAALLAALAAVSIAAGLWQFRGRRLPGHAGASRSDWAKLTALFWTVQIVLFTGFFTNPLGGLITGVAGSAGYWLGQHEVGRGSQPWYYYLILGGLYEFLIVLAGGIALVVLAARLRAGRHDAVLADVAPAGEANGAGRLFAGFLIWWTLGSAAVYGIAGERMPWLLAHQVLPLALVAGWGLARVCRDIARAPLATLLVPAAAVALALALLPGMLIARPFAGLDTGSVAATARWWTRVVGLGALAIVLFRRLRPAGGRAAARAAAAGGLLVLGLLTIRTSVQLAFVNYDLATEPMSFAQASPDVRSAMRRIEALSERTAGPRAIEVAYDDESTWPLVWYLRDYPRARTWAKTASLAPPAPVILAGDGNLAALQPLVAGQYTAFRYVQYWWPLQDYANLTPSRLLAVLGSASSREHVWKVFSRRDYGIPLVDWPMRREFHMFVRNDLAGVEPEGVTSALTTAPPVSAVGEIAPVPEQVITGPFDGLRLNAPTAIAVADEGTWLVADGGNHRVVALEPDGDVRFVLGRGRCVLEAPGRPGCLDPDGNGPLDIGDGQFNEPWGVASTPDGRMFVADTWNGRIQQFDRDGTFRRSWGAFGQPGPAGTDPAPVRLYGPRGLAVDERGRLLVADTGNRRVLGFDLAGPLPATVPDYVPGAFSEPTAVARDANGTLLVAEAWNQRIVRVDRRGHAIAAWRVAGWSSRSAEDKPSLAVDDAGFVYASDPAAGRVFVFAPSGQVEAVLRLPAHDGAPARPTGLAIDPARQRLLVLDHRGGRLLVLPLHRREP